MNWPRRVDWRSSWTATRLSGSWTRLGRALETSTVATWVRSVAAVSVLATRNSRSWDAVRATGQLARQSWLYRQFTMDTEPTPVTLDLRETRTLGPLLAAVDRFVGAAAGTDRRMHDSTTVSGLRESVRASPVRTVSTVVVGAVATNLLVVVLFRSPSGTAIGARLLVGIVALLGTQVRASADQIGGSYTVRVAERLLIPPGRPEQSTDDDDSDDESTET